ncbi:hypothetical protein CR513_02182, partial [Mucuna pruriens]
MTHQGALMDKTQTTTRHLISNMASNTQQFGIRGANQSRMLNEIGGLTELTSLVRQLAVGQHQPSIVASVCGICTSVEHPTNMCPTLQETESNNLESVAAISGYLYGKQSYQSWQFDNQYGKQPFRPRPSQGPYAAQRFGPAPNAPQGQAGYQQPSPQYQAPPFHNSSNKECHISKGPDEVASNKQSGVPIKYELQQRAIPEKHEHHHPRPQDANRIANQYCHLLSVGSSNLPSQKIPNARGNASAITLRSGKELPQPAPPTEADFEPDANSQMPQQDKIVPFPFLTRTLSTRKPESDEELLRMFRKVEINIPLVDAIKQIPKYAKFLKELCVHKRKKMKGGVEVGGIVPALTREMLRPQNFLFPMHHW